MVVGLSVAVFAQKEDDKKPKTPPKSSPPVINPAPTKPQPTKPKKSDSGVVLWKED